MTALYVTSVEASSGKTAICASLGKRLQTDGKAVGYFKTLVIGRAAKDSDTEFVAKALGLKESPEVLAPISVDSLAKAAGLSDKVKARYAAVSPGKDVVLIEGLSGLTGDAGKTSAEIVAALDAKALAILRWDGRDAGEDLISFGKLVKGRVIGAVINAVPAAMTDHVKSFIVPVLEANGIKTLAILPEDRSLLSASVADLVKSLDGQVLNSPEASAELVENVMVGALSIDSGLDYFRRKANKAVVTRGDRPDLQNAALETSTRVLILTNGIDPIPQLAYRAAEKGVPMVKVQKDTLGTLAVLEELLPSVRFQDERKLEKFSQIMARNFDFKAAYTALDL